MKNKIMTADESVSRVEDGASIMIGGFMTCGTPETLIDALVKKQVQAVTGAKLLISKTLKSME